MEAEVLPVETQPTRLMPSARARATPQVIPLSLNEPVGLKPWCLKRRFSAPAKRAASGRLQQRRVPLSERGHRAVVVQEGDQFAEAPDAAGVQVVERGPALLPQLRPLARGVPVKFEQHVQQAAAAWTGVDDFAQGKIGAAPLLHASGNSRSFSLMKPQNGHVED